MGFFDVLQTQSPDVSGRKRIALVHEWFKEGPFVFVLVSSEAKVKHPIRIRIILIR